MTPLPAQTLPLATTSPLTPRGRGGSADTPAWSTAWIHAAQMQQGASGRAQRAMNASGAPWPAGLRGAMPVVTGSAAASSRSSPGEAAPNAATPAQAAAGACVARASAPTVATPDHFTPTHVTGADVPAGTGPASVAPSAMAPQAAAPSVRAPASAAVSPAGRFIPGVECPLTDPSPGELTDSPPVGGAAGRIELPDATPRAPVRVHVDRQENGCVVWLGVDAGAESLARQIVADLTPPRPGTLPVLAIVSNGIPVYTRTRIPKESP